MIVERLDRGCKAKILHVGPERILISAFWPTVKGDDRNKINNGVTRNTLYVSRDYFIRRYGPVPQVRSEA